MKWGPKHLKSWHFSFFFHIKGKQSSWVFDHNMWWSFFMLESQENWLWSTLLQSWPTISSSNFPHFILHYRGFKLILSIFFSIWYWIELQERLSVMGKSNEQDLWLPTRKNEIEEFLTSLDRVRLGQSIS